MSGEYSDEESTTGVGPVPAAPTSPLASLRERRQKSVDTLFIDLEVPRYDPPLFVRFGPISDERIELINKQHAKSKDKARNVNANAVALAESCLGVFEKVDGERVSVDPENRSSDPAEWLRFDKQLGALLGDPDTVTAAEVVRLLYLTDGDVLATAAKVTEWSGFSLAGIEEDEQGN